MSTAAVKIPQPLTSEEIKNGIVAHIKEAGVSPEICEAIRAGLNRTCSLNRQNYSKFKASWTIRDGRWKVDYVLDDFGRLTEGMIGGEISDRALDLEGKVGEMPPNAFRRKTEQPVPAPSVVKQKKEDGVGMTLAQKSGGKKKMT